MIILASVFLILFTVNWCAMALVMLAWHHEQKSLEELALFGRDWAAPPWWTLVNLVAMLLIWPASLIVILIFDPE